MNLRNGPWALPDVRTWLDGAHIPLRLAVTTRAGAPLVLSLWYLREGDALWCATQADADVVEHLRADPRCAFEVGPDAPPYRGVRGTATARIVPERGAEILERLCQRYLDESNRDLARWLTSRGGEVAIRLDDLAVSTWDFAGRMAAQPVRLPPPGAGADERS